MSPKKNRVPVIAVLNLKGGVGKTTVSAHVFRILFERLHASTLLLDLDPQFNLTQTLVTRNSYDKLKEEGKTVLSIMEPPPIDGMFDIKTTDKPPPDAKQICHSLRTFKHSGKTLDLIPGDFQLVKYSLMSQDKKLQVVAKRFQNFIESSKNVYNVICIDCNPSSSFLTLCALEACTHILVPVRPDRYSMLGIELLSEFLDGIPTVNPKPELMILLNGIPKSNYDQTVENEIRAHPRYGKQTLITKLHNSQILLAKPNYTGFATEKKVPHRTALRSEINKIVDEIAAIVGVKNEE